MQFSLRQEFSVAADRVVVAYSSPALYDTFDGLDNIGPPVVVNHQVQDSGEVHLQVRYHYTGDLPPGASAFIDTSNIAVTEASVIDPARRSSTFELRTGLGRQFRGAGRTLVEPGPSSDTSIRRLSGDLRIGIPLVGSKVERAIIDGLAESLQSQVGLVEDWVHQSEGNE